MTHDRHPAARRVRRIIMNNDGDDYGGWHVPGGLTPEAFLACRTAALADSQVDTISYCTGGFNKYSHLSRFCERVSHQGRPAPRGVGVDDPLQLIIAFCRQHGKEVFWSMRMNDTHDSWDPAPDGWSQWKKDHPECLIATLADRDRGYLRHISGRWSSLNYEHPLVRERVVAILSEVIAQYDVDGVELDFFRHPVVFPPQIRGEPATPTQAGLLTEMLREVRRAADAAAPAKGHPVLVTARVPDSVSYARTLGLDMAAWAEEGLIDLLIGGGLFRLEPWANLAAFGRRHDLPVYAGIENFQLVADTPEHWRGEALKAWEAGVSGIYTFNLFDPRSPLFRELGDPAILRQRPWVYAYDPWLNGGHRMHQGPDDWLRAGFRFITEITTTERGPRPPAGG